MSMHRHPCRKYGELLATLELAFPLVIAVCMNIFKLMIDVFIISACICSKLISVPVRKA